MPRVAGSLRHRPAVVILKLGEQAVHHIAAGQTSFPTGETRCDPAHQLIEQPPVRGMVSRVTSGCRLVVLFHKLA